jgi:hypothetical protein
MVGALVTLGIGIASLFWLRRIRSANRAERRVADRVAADPVAAEDRLAAAASGESPLTVARRR